MKHYLHVFILVLLPVAAVFAQPRYSVEKIPLCWTVGSTDSSITKVVLISSASDQLVTIGYYNADGNDITVSGGSLQFGYCGTGGGGGGGGDDDWRWYGAVETYSKPLYRIGKTNIFVTTPADTTHGFRVDSTFQFKMDGRRDVFDWQVGGGTGTDYTPHAGLFYRGRNTFESSLVGSGHNNITLGADDNTISDRDRLGAIIFAGKNPAGSGGYRPGAMITAFADVPAGGWSGDSSATSLNFYVTRPNQNTLTNIFTMQRDGRFEMDRYQFFEDGVPERMLGFDDGSDDVTVHSIDGTPGNNSILGLNATGSGLEWKETSSIVQQENRLLVVQPSHGFTLPAYGFKPVYKSTSDGKWRAASTTSDSTLHNGFVVEIVSSDSFWIQTTGIFQTASNHGLTDARDYFLQDDGTISTSADATYNDWVSTVLDSNHVDLKTLHVFQSDTSTIIGNQTISFNSSTGNLSILNGNTIDLDGRWIEGSLTPGRIPRATGATAVVDGTIRDDGSNIGVGQSPGTGRLEVTGSGTSTTPTLLLQSSSGTDNFSVLDDGRVAVGNAVATGVRLHVIGSGTSSSSVSIMTKNSALNETFRVGDDGIVIVAGTTASISGGLQIGSDNNRVQNLWFSGTTGGNKRISASGEYIRIGTATAAVLAIHTDNSSITVGGGTSTFVGGINWDGSSLSANSTKATLSGMRSARTVTLTNGGFNLNHAGFRDIHNTTFSGVSSAITGINVGFLVDRSLNQSSVTDSAIYKINHIAFSDRGTYNTIAYNTPVIGFEANPTLTGTVSYAAFRGRVASGTRRWNLKMNGSADNWLAGNTIISTTDSIPGPTFLDLGAATTSKSSLRMRAGTAPSTPADGDAWNDDAGNSISVNAGGLTQKLSGCIFTGTADATVSNDTTVASITPAGSGTLTLPANYLVAGKTIRIKIGGHYRTDATTPPDLDIIIKFGSTIVCRMGSSEMTITDTGDFTAEFIVTCRSAGASGTVMGRASAIMNYGPSGTQRVWVSQSDSTVTINTTSSANITANAQWSVLDTDNSITTQIFTVEVL